MCRASSPLPLLPTLLIVAACGGSAARAPSIGNAPGSAASGGSLEATLLREVGAGAAVAIVPGPLGLRAVSADGDRQRTLVPGPVPWALVDHRAGVVWFGSADAARVLAIDLEAPAATPPAVETIVTGAAFMTDAGPAQWTVRYAGSSPDAEPEELSSGHPIGPHVVLDVTGSPRLRGSGMILALWNQLEDFDTRVQQTPIVGHDLVAAWALRGADRSVNPGGRLADRPVVAGIDQAGCDEADICGTAQALEGTDYWRVAESFSCGDGCYTGWRLYTPTTQAFVDADWGTWIDDAWVAPDGSGFVSAGRIVRFDQGPLDVTDLPDLTDGGGSISGGGWLGGGQYVGW